MSENEQPVENKPKGKRKVTRVIGIIAVSIVIILIIVLLITGDNFKFECLLEV